MSNRPKPELMLAAMLLFPLATETLAQQPAGPPSHTAQPAQASNAPTLKVKTQLTIEDVTVTDDKGRPVHGLTEYDFTVKEDGKPQTIKDFHEYSAQPPQAGQAPPRLPPNVYTNQQATVPSAYNILYFDNVTSSGSVHRAPENLMVSKQQTLKYLKTMPPGTEVAILVRTDGLRIVQGFTSDRDLLLAAVNSIRPEAVLGTFVPPLPQGPFIPLPPGLSDDSSATLETCMAMNVQNGMTTDALDQIAAFASGIKGRKNLIWFTPGIPWLTYAGLSKTTCINDPTRPLHRAYALLTAARVAIDPVDPRGVRQLGVGQGSMQDMAEATGGKAYFGSNDMDAEIGEAIATGSNYYSLTYVPPLSKSDGKLHSINVKVDHPGVHLQYRDSYVASDYAPPKPDTKSLPGPDAPDSDFNAAMQYGLPGAAELPFTVTVQPSTQASGPDGASGATALGAPSPTLKGTPLVRYDFLYELPGSEIALATDAAAGTEKGSLQLLIAAYSTDGELLNTLGQTAAFTIKPDEVEQFRQQAERVPVQMDLPPGKVVLRVGVLDVSSEKMGVTEIAETVVQPAPGRAGATANVKQPPAPKRAAQAETGKALSVAQMEALLTAGEGKSDDQVAQQLAGVELSERVSLARMTRWEQMFSGNKTHEQLVRLADSASFLDPPAEDVVADAMPDAAARTKIFAQAVDFVKTTFTRLPNFYATRYTTHFSNEANAAQKAQESILQKNLAETRPLLVIGTYSMTVAFRDGAEVHEKGAKGTKAEPAGAGLTTSGEFGPVLQIVLGDAIRSQSVGWSRWERGEGGPVAVFRYSVPQAGSTFSTQVSDGLKSVDLQPGYHGEIAIDPASGSILRISVVTDMAPPHEATAMSMLIEYGPVTMGGHAYICPVHGVAYSRTAGIVIQTAGSLTPETRLQRAHTELNDTVFTQYHRFGAEVKIVSGDASQPDGKSP